jgi:nucleoporin p58/p45
MARFSSILAVPAIFDYIMKQGLVNTTSSVHSDLLLSKDLKAKADQAVQDTIVLTHIIDGFKNPQQHGAYLKTHASFPFE